MKLVNTNWLASLVAVVVMLTATGLPAEETLALSATVVGISEEYGNIDSDLDASDLQTLGLEQGQSFSVSFGDRTFSVYLGRTYSDVPRGEWIAFITDMGNLRIARNFENAASTLGVRQGDTITLSPTP